MCGHELCHEGVYYSTPFAPEKYLGKTLIEESRDKVIADLTRALKHYAGIAGNLAFSIDTTLDFDMVKYPHNTFFIKDKNGVVIVLRTECVAREVLREYNLIDQEAL